MNDRILKLISEEDFEKIQSTNILLIGLGGVGGYAFESLVRSGFLSITVIDKDVFEETNLNRQILALSSTIGLPKVLAACERAQKINKNVTIQTLQKKLLASDITDDFLKPFHYIIDACDDVSVKITLMRKCNILKKKLISAMGCANRTHPEELEIVQLKDTKCDPLARRIRMELKNEKQLLSTWVVCSKEVPKKQKELGTFNLVPMGCGALLVSFVINDLLRK